MKILAIESSCDETASAVVEDGRKVLSSVISSQVAEHRKYGGVVPEIASRRHAEDIVPVVDRALADANVTLDESWCKLCKRFIPCYRQAFNSDTPFAFTYSI